MHSLLYLSVRRYPAYGAEADIEDILAVSRPRNAALGVTGALVATPGHFAQLLEGSEAALADLMVSIRKDDRHERLSIVTLDARPHRELEKWSLAYNGDSTYVAHMIAATIDASDFEIKAHAERIRALMLMFA